MAAAARALLDTKNPSFRGRRLLSPSPKIRRSRWSNAIAPARRAADLKPRQLSRLGESVMKMHLSPDHL
jgi:hypothetical protein